MIRFHIYLLVCLLTSLVRAQEKIPVLSFSGLDYHSAHMFSLQTQTLSKPLALVFISAKCPCSVSYFPTLDRLYRLFPNVTFVGIHSNADEMTPEFGKRLITLAPKFPILQDSQSKLVTAFGALKTPHVFLYTSDGSLAYEGGIDNSKRAENASEHYLESALHAVSQGRRPEVTSYRTLGCAIARAHEKK